MGPKNGRKSQEGERLKLSLRKLDREMRMLCELEDFHLTKSKEVKVQLTKIGDGLARARAGAAEKRVAMAQAQRELDLAPSQEAQAKRDGERLTLQLGELSATGEAKKIKDQRDRVAKVAVVTPWLPVNLESEDSGWTSEPGDKVAEQRDKLAKSIRRTGSWPS